MAATPGLVLDCADPDKLAEFWAVAIGYTTLEEHGNHWVVVTDPEGNEFCVCNAGQAA